MGGAHFAGAGAVSAGSDAGAGTGRRRLSLALVYVAVVALVVASAALRYRSGEIRYQNEDATWHVMLTVEAYNETPASQHLFLPLVSLGEEADKSIAWGHTIPDDQGNYYYTSFSPAGFFVAWAFTTALGLPVSESSLYLLNTVLLCASAAVLVHLLATVYDRSRHRAALSLVGAVAYVLVPEVLHGMGIVYWHQSVMQVTLLLQVAAYYHYAVRGSRGWRAAFYVLALVNPYVEWTGYVANVGFALAELARGRADGWRRALGRAAAIGGLTLCSLALFCGHYLLRVSPEDFFGSLLFSFTARSAASEQATFLDLLAGYPASFLWLWPLLGVVLVWALVARRGRLSLLPGTGTLLFVAAFPVLENVVMKQHAVAYPYDRMKAAFVLVILLCELARNALEAADERRGEGRRGGLAAGALVALTVAAGALNLASYVRSDTYIWDFAYRADNEAIARAVTERYPDAVYACNRGVRGYANMLFGRGIYEFQTVESAREIADERGADTVVYVVMDPPVVLDVQVYGPDAPEGVAYTAEDGEVTVTEGVPAELVVQPAS